MIVYIEGGKRGAAREAVAEWMERAVGRSVGVRRSYHAGEATPLAIHGLSMHLHTSCLF